MIANSSPPSRAIIWPSSRTPLTQRAHRLQQRVAGGMAEQVVDLLEAVEVEAQHGKPFAVREGRLDLLVELAC